MLLTGPPMQGMGCRAGPAPRQAAPQHAQPGPAVAAAGQRHVAHGPLPSRARAMHAIIPVQVRAAALDLQRQHLPPRDMLTMAGRCALVLSQSRASSTSDTAAGGSHHVREASLQARN